MKCLCCGKDIDKNGENGWHKSCIKRFSVHQNYLK